MASKRYGGVRFVAYPQDHTPRHVHAFFAGTEVVVDLRASGGVALAQRSKAIRPKNAKRSAVRHALEVAAKHFDELVMLWESMHG